MPIPLEVAERVAQALVARLPHAEQITIAGSIRRSRPALLIAAH